MEYITTKAASAKWGISVSRIGILLNEGRIPGAYRLGRSWFIPASATKPPERKAHHPHSDAEEMDQFSFPMYPFRPDWSSAKEAQLSEQQRSLLLAEQAVLECRFADAYPQLEAILHAPEDIGAEIGSLWNAGICCIALNRPDDFSKIYLRLQVLMSGEFPHRDDYATILDALNTYVETIGSTARSDTCNVDIHEQCLPLACLQAGYAQLIHEAMKSGTADTTMLELNLRFLQTTSAVVSTELMHIYLLGIYSMRQAAADAEKHARAAIQIVFETKLYFPLVTYYRYFAPVLSPVLAQYPEDFQALCHELIAQYEKNFTACCASVDEYAVISQLSNEEYPYIYAVLSDQSNTFTADKLGVHPQTVKNKIARICKKLGVKNKKELREYLRSYL